MLKIRSSATHQSGFGRAYTTAMAVLALGLLASGAAKAGCDPRDLGHFQVKLPPSLLASSSSGSGTNSIVGLFHAVYTATDGTDFGYQSFDVWHSDGTEFESADIPPGVGPLCVGVWQQTGSHVVLNHYGWTWDGSGNPTGSFNLTESLTVGPAGNAYQGTFDFKPYDTSGNLEPSGEHRGTVVGGRISLTTHAAD